MAEETTYTGGCHCGKVRWEVTAKVENVIACNVRFGGHLHGKYA